MHDMIQDRSGAVIIRPKEPFDVDAIVALERRVEPYRPEDQTAVDAMFGRAKEAERRGDPRWMPQTPPMAQVEEAVADELGLWVAQPVAGDAIVGVVGLYRAGLSSEIPKTEIRAASWRDREDVAELRRLRVDSEWRRVGVGTTLNQTALEWARGKGFREVVLNTTSAQIPALALYSKLGFQEIFRSFVGAYELIWMSRRL